MRQSTGIYCVALFVIFSFCSNKQFDNPIGSGYPGNYAFAVRDSLLPATMEVFKPYYVLFTKGTDAFASFGAGSGIESILDISVINDMAANDTITLYFKKPFQGDVVLKAVRPNGAVLLDTVENLVVKNPYILSVPLVIASGEQISGKIIRDDGTAISAEFTAEWIINGEKKAPQSASATYTYSPSSNQTQIISAYLRHGGTTGDSLVLGPVSVQIGGSRPLLDSMILGIRDTIQLGNGLTARTYVTDADNTPYAIHAVKNSWRDSSAVASFLSNRIALLDKPVLDTGTQYFKVFIKDAGGLTSDTITKRTYVQYTLPQISFAQAVIDIPIGQQFSLVATTTACDSLLWHFKNGNRDTVTTGSLKVLYPAVGMDTIIIRGKSRFGFVSAPETLVVRIITFTYTLQGITGQFPDTMRAKHWSAWQVVVMSNTTPYTGGAIHYRWKTPSTVSFDSVNYSADSSRIKLYLADSVAPFMLSVSARTGTDSTNILQQNIVVRRFKPSCTFSQANYTTAINTDLSVTLQTQDANADGSIAGIYYSHSDQSTIQSTNNQKTWAIRFNTTGQKTVKAFVIDNDGFSDTTTTAVLVIANKPYFSRPAIDTSLFIKDPVTLKAPALSGNAGDSIVQYRWDLNNDNTYELTTTKDTLDTIFSTTGIKIINVQCRDSQNDTAAQAMSFTITVKDGAPQVKTITCTPSIVYMGQQVTVHIIASDTNGMVKRLALKINNNADTIINLAPSKTIDTSFNFTFAQSGKYLIQAAVYDDDSVKSAYRAANDSITVNRGEPVVTLLTPDTAWLNTDTALTITAIDNGSVAGYAVSYNNTTFSAYTTSPTFRHTFTATGINYVYLKVKDNDNNVSAVYKDSLFIKTGSPVITGVRSLTNTDSLFVRDSLMFKVYAQDSNKTLRTLYVSWYNTATADDSVLVTRKTDTVQFGYRALFADSGIKTIRFWAKDDDNFLSTAYSMQITIRTGRPQLARITTDTAINNIYIRDLVTYRIKGTDPNDHIDTIFVSWNGDTLFEQKTYTTSDSAAFIYAFARQDSGVKNILFRLKDADGLTRDSIIPITVKAGFPVVTHAWCTRDTIWGRDTNVYRIKATEPNGTIRKIYASWQGTNTADDSLTITEIFNTIDTAFTHAYDTTGGNKTARFWVADDDSLNSAKKDTALVVRKGAPLVWAENGVGGFGDTLWVVVDKGYSGTAYYYKVNHFDTNGTINKYYWATSVGDTAGANKTTVDSINIAIDDLNINKPAANRYIYGLDNDGLLRGNITGNKFVVFADSAPPKPDIDKNQPGGGVINIKWRNEDTKDGQQTEYAIVLGNSAEILTDTLVNFTIGTSTSFTKASGWYNYQFNATTQGYTSDFYYMVVSRDARRTKSKSNGGLGSLISTPY